MSSYYTNDDALYDFDDGYETAVSEQDDGHDLPLSDSVKDMEQTKWWRMGYNFGWREYKYAVENPALPENMALLKYGVPPEYLGREQLT